MTLNAVWSPDELSSLRFIDQILPAQPHLSKMYKGDAFYEKMADTLFSVLDDKGEVKFDVRLKKGMSYAAMGSAVNTLHFYQFLIRQAAYKNILELGTYLGVSAMYMAEAVGNDGHVTTVEKGAEFYNIARGNVDRNGFTGFTPDPQIKLVCMDALSFLRLTKERFDFILLDAAKEIYKELLELSIEHLTPEGTIIVDDVFFQGDTLNDRPATEKGKGVKDCLDYAAKLEGWERVIIPIGNGLMLMRRV